MSEQEGQTRTDVSMEFKHEPTRDLYGWITHTDLLSNDALATKQWCAQVFGWNFKAVLPGPTGEYHLFAYSENGGGGIRQTAPNEQPGSMPFVSRTIGEAEL